MELCSWEDVAGCSFSGVPEPGNRILHLCGVGSVEVVSGTCVVCPEQGNGGLAKSTSCASLQRTRCSKTNDGSDETRSKCVRSAWLLEMYVAVLVVLLVGGTVELCMFGCLFISRMKPICHSAKPQDGQFVVAIPISFDTFGVKSFGIWVIFRHSSVTVEGRARVGSGCLFFFGSSPANLAVVTKRRELSK